MIKKILLLVLSYFSLTANSISPNDYDAKIIELVNSIVPKQVSYDGQTLTFFKNPDNFEIGMLGTFGLTFFALNAALNYQDRKYSGIQEFNIANAMLLGISSYYSFTFFYKLYFKIRKLKYAEINKDSFIVDGKIHNLQSISQIIYNVYGTSSLYYSSEYSNSKSYELIAFDANNKQILNINSDYLTQINSGQFRDLLVLILKKFNCKISIKEHHKQMIYY